MNFKDFLQSHPVKAFSPYNIAYICPKCNENWIVTKICEDKMLWQLFYMIPANRDTKFEHIICPDCWKKEITKCSNCVLDTTTSVRECLSVCGHTRYEIPIKKEEGIEIK